MLENLFYQEQDKSISVAKETVGIVISLQHMRTIIRLRHMRCAIACTCLFACLKYWRQAKKSTPCLIKKASRCVAGRTSKTTTFFAFTFCKTERSYKKIMCICYFIGSVAKIVLSEAATGGVLYKKLFLKFAKFTGKYKCQSPFFNKFAGAVMSLLIVLT